MKTLNVRPYVAILLLVAVTTAFPVLSQPSDVLATVNGGPITEGDLRKEIGTELKMLELQHERDQHKLREETLHKIIEGKLLEAEAKAKGVSSDQLLADLAAPAVTDAEIGAFYDENQKSIAQPKEQIAGEIRKYLAEQKRSSTRAAYMKSLEKKYKVVMNLEPFRLPVAESGPSFGPAGAPVTIIEFTDFQCPFCARMAPTIDKVMTQYKDRVRLVVRQFPLSAIHPNAAKAAEASLCANEQGKFREIHDAMFANQKQLAVPQLEATAAALGMDAAKFHSCMESGKYASQVTTDLRDGRAALVEGTPMLIINGRPVSGAVPIEAVTTVIDDELQRKGMPKSAN